MQIFLLKNKKQKLNKTMRSTLGYVIVNFIT